ncbi:MAG: family 1 glycosylhydrolase [Clostridia bacterium]
MQFSENFLWGAASADYQVEGGWNADGKGPGIWDALHTGHIAHGESGDIACDHYHRFREDVAIMREIGLKSYRFSVSWPRVLPAGKDHSNPAGLRFYSELVDELLASGITPILTLYHWNMPQALYELGGWENPESPDWFAAYAGLMADTLGERVPYWLTFNEPQMFMGLGYRVGIHAPFQHVSDERIVTMSKNIMLAHGKAVRVLRGKLGSRVQIGIAPTGDVFIPKNDEPATIAEAKTKSFVLGKEFVMSNTWWGDPIHLGCFPEEAYQRFGSSALEMDFSIVHQPLDFYAYNVYQGASAIVGPQEYGEYEYAGSPKTSFGWSITPDVMYWASKWLYERYHKPILITENGYSSLDFVSRDGKVHDPQRIDFLYRYLLALKRAASEDVPVIGYTTWSLLDNFEWASGYDMRYGLVYVDFQTQQRIRKDSAEWYQSVIQTNGAFICA